MKSERQKAIDHIIKSAEEEVELMDTSDSEIDEIMDDMEEDLTIILAHRYFIPSTLVPKSDAWLYEVLPEHLDNRFKKIVRVTREQFGILLALIEDHEVFNGRSSQLQAPVSKQLAITLYRLGSYGSGATLAKIANLFGIGDGGTCDGFLKRVVKVLMELHDKYIFWPNKSERSDMVAEKMDELPRCVGYVDGCEIHLDEAPETDPEQFFSRKKRYGLKAQAVGDHDLLVRHLHVGYTARVHDARIFAESELGTNPEKFFDDDQWLAADSAYKLTTTVLVPFKSNSTFGTARGRRRFNKYFSSFRVRIERLFGIVKERFESLKTLRVRIRDEESYKLAVEWIVACFVLHNILRPHMNEDELEYDVEDEDEEEELMDGDGGETKREALYHLVLQKLDN